MGNRSGAARPFQHTILDIKTKAARRLGSASARRLITEAAKAGGLRVIRVSSHAFSSNAFTAFALLSQSHIAIHTWPEYDYVACDVFSCGGEMAPVVKHILERLSPLKVYDRFLPRGVPSKGRMKTIYVDDTGPGVRTLFDVRVLAMERSRYQEIEVLKHEKFGKMLVINGDVQFAESDHRIYDEALMHSLKELRQCRRVLIIGGGDGLCCTYLIENGIGSEIGVLELDAAVPRVCLKNFPRLSKGLKDSRVRLVLGDAVKSIKRLADGSFDAVVVDTTAPDTKWGVGTYSPSFLVECRRVLRSGGLLTMNGSSLWYDYDVSTKDIRRNIKGVFGRVEMETALIPSFGSPWSFFSARKRAAPTDK